MGGFLVYILKSSVCLALFYLFYKLLLSKDTFHRFNRVALLASALLASLIPFIEITTKESHAIHQFVLENHEMLASLMQQLPEAAPSNPWLPWLLVIYPAGIFFFLVHFLVSMLKIKNIIQGGEKRRLEEDGMTLVLVDKAVSPFSWLKYVVINTNDWEESGPAILAHEKAHIRLGHSFDMAVSALCVLFQWFNPAAWLLIRELQNIHEYEADESVINQGIDAKRYQLLLIKKAVGAKRFMSMANSFNHSKIKKRITMMVKSKSNSWARLKYAYVLPLAALAIAAFARPEIATSLEAVSQSKISEIIPKAPNPPVIISPDAIVLPGDSITVVKELAEIVEEHVALALPEVEKSMQAVHVSLEDSLALIISEKMDVNLEEIKVDVELNLEKIKMEAAGQAMKDGGVAMKDAEAAMKSREISRKAREKALKEVEAAMKEVEAAMKEHEVAAKVKEAFLKAKEIALKEVEAAMNDDKVAKHIEKAKKEYSEVKKEVKEKVHKERERVQKERAKERVVKEKERTNAQKERAKERVIREKEKEKVLQKEEKA